MAFYGYLPFAIASGSLGATDLANFTVIVRGTYPDLRTVANGGRSLHGVGDIRFFSDTGLSAALNYQIISYDPTTGALKAAVQLPTLAHASTNHFYCAVGNAALTTDGSSAAAWDANDKAVLEFGDGSTLSLLDSTANGHNGTNNGGTLATGGLGAALSVAGAQWVDMGTPADLDFVGAFTVTCVIKAVAVATGGQQQIVSKGYDGNTQWQLALNVSDAKATVGAYSSGGAPAGGANSTSNIVPGVETRLTAGYDGTSWRMYVNGALESTGVGSGPIHTSQPTYLGAVAIFGTAGQFYAGQIQDVRLASGMRSASWVTATHNNLASPSTFAVVGALVTVAALALVTGRRGAVKFLVELDAYDPAAAAVKTLLYGTAGYTTGPTATPANAYYDGRLVQPVDISRSLFAGGTSSGSARVSLGDIVLNNPDGKLDALLTYGFDGRTITVRRTTAAKPQYPADFVTVFVGTVAGAEFDTTTITLKLRDMMYLLTLPVQPATYGGTNVLPNGVDGVAADLMGQQKPRMFGTVLNVAPPCVNTSKLVYQFNDGPVADISAMYDRAVPLSPGPVYTSFAQMMDDTQEPAPGYFRAWLAGGMARLGTRPVGLVTGNVSEGATVADRTIGQVATRLLLLAGYSGASVLSSDITTLDAALPDPVGLWLRDATTFQTALEQVAGPEVWFGLNRMGVFRLVQLTKPSGTPVIRFTANDLVKPLSIVPTNDPGNGIPVYSVTVRYAHNYNIQNSDFLSATDIDVLQTINAPLEAGAEKTTGKSIDVLADGTVYARVKAVDVSNGQIVAGLDTVDATSFTVNEQRRQAIVWATVG